ncbi:MAG TPA: hypothetical protein VL689_02620 [Paraburkholderia sp.]|nr:hypothetical protein [Paraburkholderia sp.]
MLSLAWLALVTTGTIARAEGIPIVTGEQWVHSTDDVKKAYLVGMANLLDVERAYYASQPPPDSQDIAPRFSKGMQGQTLDGVRQGLDAWYAANPTQLRRPVIDTIWTEMVQPGLKQNP